MEGLIFGILLYFFNLRTKSYGVTIQIKPLWQNVCIVLFIS